MIAASVSDWIDVVDVFHRLAAITAGITAQDGFKVQRVGIQWLHTSHPCPVCGLMLRLAPAIDLPLIGTGGLRVGESAAPLVGKTLLAVLGVVAAGALEFVALQYPRNLLR